jgi:hypothetical protein
MRVRTQALALFALFGFAAEQAVAQPIPPPRRPTFSSYGNIYAQGTLGYGGAYGGLFGPAYGYGGYGGYGYGGYGNAGWANFGNNALIQQQNQLLTQQLNQVNQNLQNFQTFMATGVNPNFPVTGHAAVFNNLGHWYGSGSGGMIGGGLGSGMLTTGRTAGIGYPVGGAGATPGAAGGANANQPRTAGSGIPIGGPRR